MCAAAGRRHHPGVASWPAGVRRRLRELRSSHSRLVAIAEAAERTLCHLDVWPANLIDHDGASVLLDWSFAGDGAVGEDIANLIIDSCADGLMDAALLPEIEASAIDGYLRGLRDGGWTGSADAVRSTIAACGAAKYSWFAPAIAGRAARDHIGQSSYGQDSSARRGGTPGNRAGYAHRQLVRGGPWLDCSIPPPCRWRTGTNTTCHEITSVKSAFIRRGVP